MEVIRLRTEKRADRKKFLILFGPSKEEIADFFVKTFDRVEGDLQFYLKVEGRKLIPKGVKLLMLSHDDAMRGSAFELTGRWKIEDGEEVLFDMNYDFIRREGYGYMS